MYALRFLRVSLSLDMNQNQENLAAFSQLRTIVSTADDRGDVGIATAACATEALTHVNRSSSSESIEQAQRALASVRSAQMSSEAANIPSLIIMAHFVDVMCSLIKDEHDLGITKMKAMHASLEELRDRKDWKEDGNFKVPISQPAFRAAGSSQGVVLLDTSGKSSLQLKWLPKDEIYTLGYMLSAAVSMAKNPQERMSENFLKEAIGRFDPAGDGRLTYLDSPIGRSQEKFSYWPERKLATSSSLSGADQLGVCAVR